MKLASMMVGKLAAKALRPVNSVLDPLERRFTRANGDRFRHPLIFIIGSPRSGSTLLYQVLTSSIECGYFTNAHAALYGAPALMQRALGPLLRSTPLTTFESSDGQSRGYRGPAEAGQFWYRWFPRQPQYVAADSVGLDRLRSLRAVIADMVTSFDAPIVFKNLTCGMRLHALARLFPEALFVVLRRDPLWTAHSLLVGRKRLFNDATHWWSLQPPTIDDIQNLPPADQVARQVVDIYRTIDRDAAILGADRFHDVGYEAFCADPRATVNGIIAWVERHGWTLNRRSTPPEEFPRSEAKRLDAAEFAALEQAVERALRHE